MMIDLQQISCMLVSVHLELGLSRLQRLLSA